MAVFKMIAGTHAEGDRYWDQKGSLVESDRDLETLFGSAKFQRVDGQKATPPSPVPGERIRRTAASEAQSLQKDHAGHAVAVGGSPGPEVDVENAKAAAPLDDEEAGGEFYDPEFDTPEATLKTGRRGTNRRAKSSPREAQVEAEAEDETEDVTESFPKAGELGLTVQREGRTYFLVNENGNRVGERSGYSSKAAVNEALSSR